MKLRRRNKFKHDCEAFGIKFDHPIALAPGLVPDGELYNTFKSYSFVEIGPLTVKPQGDTGVRKLFSRHKAVRTGLANKGIRNSIAHLQAVKPQTIIAANLAPAYTHHTAEDIVKDVTEGFSLMYDFADMFIIDTFRSNADGLAPMQSLDILSEVMDSILDMRRCYDEAKPILVRVTPLISRAILSDVLDYMRLSGIDGVIAGYDTYCPDFVKEILDMTQRRYPVIACGDINSPRRAIEMLDLGAVLVQANASVSWILNYIEKTVDGSITIDNTLID